MYQAGYQDLFLTLFINSHSVYLALDRMLKITCSQPGHVSKNLCVVRLQHTLYVINHVQSALQSMIKIICGQPCKM